MESEGPFRDERSLVCEAIRYIRWREPDVALIQKSTVPVSYRNVFWVGKGEFRTSAQVQ